MPYSGEPSGRLSHTDILNNPEVRDFLNKCSEVPRPTKSKVSEIFNESYTVNELAGDLPKLVIAIDGSPYESSLDEDYPSRKIGYLKISMVVLDMAHYQQLEERTTKYVNPMEIAKLEENTSAITMALPSSFVKLPDCETIKEGYRREILNAYSSDRTLLGGESLLDTLYTIASEMGRVDSDDNLIVTLCPNPDCEKPTKEEQLIPRSSGLTTCKHCGESIYATDILRTYEEFSEAGSNLGCLNRLMLVTEHLLAIHYINYLYRKNKTLLGDVCILIDGNLSIHGPPAPLHSGVMKLLNKIRESQKSAGLNAPTVFGLSKTGRMAEHGLLLKRVAQTSGKTSPDGFVYMVPDSYRYEFIQPPPKAGKSKNYGHEDYYGQDFLVNTPKGKSFAMCLAYPFGTKDKDFQSHKTADISAYRPQLDMALAVLLKLETDLYENAVIPIILAHRHASISVTPGGRVIDILTNKIINGLL